MKMKHWIKSSDGDVIALADPDSPGDSARIFGIVVNDDGSLNIGDDGQGQYDFDATPVQLIEAFEEALAWLKEQARASDPLVQAMDDAVKRLAALGIGILWREEFIPGKALRNGQMAEAKKVVVAYMTCPKNAIFGRHERRQVIEYPNYTAVEIEFSSIEEVEQFISDNAHLAN